MQTFIRRTLSFYLLTFVPFYLLTFAPLPLRAQTEGEKALFQLRKDMPSKAVVVNPVTDFDCPDPSIVKIDDWFYCFKTGFPIKIYRSRDLADWTFYRDMFPGPTPHDPFGDGKPDPMKTGAGKQNINYWAPSPALIQGRTRWSMLILACRAARSGQHATWVPARPRSMATTSPGARRHLRAHTIGAHTDGATAI